MTPRSLGRILVAALLAISLGLAPAALCGRPAGAHGGKSRMT